MAYYIHDGETCTGIILEYDQMFVSSGGTANSTIINTSGYLEVDSGGTAIDTIINDRKSGGLFITLGGVANGATVNYGGYMRILPDGKAKNVVENGGYVYIDEELEKGNPNVTFRKNSFSGVVLSGYDTGEKRKATVHSGTTANNTTVKSNGVLEILGGIANGTTVVSGGDMIIFSGTANSTVVNSDGYVGISSGGVIINTEIKNCGYVDVSSGGVANSTTINDGDTGGLFVTPGGVANDVTVNFGGYMKVFSEGKAKNVVENGGYVYIVDELENGHPNVTFKKNSFSGVVLYDEKRKASVHSGTTAIDTTIDSDGTFRVLGGIANGTTVNSGGEMYVHSGIASSTTVNSGGYLEITSDGTATRITENGGYVSIAGDTDYIEHPNVTILPNSFTGLVLNGTSATIHSGTTADDTMVGADGLLCIFSGGFANDVTVDPNGKLWIYSGGLANGITLGNGGELIVGYGGWITGRMTFQAGALVTPATEAILDFDLRQTAPGEAALVNDLSFIPNTFLFTITVNGMLSDGTYKLAGGAAAFDQTVCVINTSGRTLGTITVGGTFSTALADYTLKKNGSELTLDVVSKMIENGPGEPYNNELYYKKTKSVNDKVTDSYGVYLSSADDEIFIDKFGTVDHDGYCNRVEKAVKGEERDTIDYAKFVLEHGAQLSFHAEATAAAKFTVYSLTQNKNGKYKLKKLQTLKLKDKDKDGVFTADSSKLLQLQASGAYYVSMQYTDKRKDVTEAYYSVTLNGGDKGCVFYPLGDNSDDWGDLKSMGWAGAVDDLGVLNGSVLAADNTIIQDEWIGFGDKFDYKRFTLESAAELDFTVDAPDGPLKLSVCKLKEKTKKGVTNYSLVTVKAIKLKVNQGSVQMNDLRLEAGDYCVKVESSNVKKSTGYDVQVTGNVFYTDGDNGWNDVLLDGKVLHDNVKHFFDNKLAGTGSIHFDKAGNDMTSSEAAEFSYNKKHYDNFVGFGDEIDFARISLSSAADVTFSITATGDATLEIIQLTRKGETYTKKILQTTKLKVGDKEEQTAAAKKAVHFECTDGIEYCISVKATNTKKTTVDPRVYYNVSYIMDSTEPACALDMPKAADPPDGFNSPVDAGSPLQDDLLAGTANPLESFADTSAGLLLTEDKSVHPETSLLA